MSADRSTTRPRLLLERGEELRRIDEVLERSRGGAGSILLIEGPPGIGKTELVAAARRRAAENGLAVASARGSELERELPYGIVRQLLEPLVANPYGDSRAELFAGAAAPAESLLTSVPLGNPDVGPADDKGFAALHALYWVCAHAAAIEPLALAVDDAHWADQASLRFLAYLAQRLEGLPLALVVAARPAESPAEEELLVRLASDPPATAVSPAPLSIDAVATLIAGELGHEPERAFAHACHRATGGTPFLVRELIRDVDAEGIEPIAAEAGRIEEMGPGTVARAVVSRVRRLSPEALRLARAAAVLGSDAAVHRLGRLAEVEDASVAAGTLDSLAQAAVLAPGRPIEFAHPIIRSAIYSQIPAGERSSLHARAAELLAAEAVPEDRVATHLLATDPAGRQESVALLVRTAVAALARGAPSSAVSYLERAVREPPDPGSRAGVLHRLGIAEIQAGDPNAAARHLEQARRLADDPLHRAGIARDLVAPLMAQERRDAAVEVLWEALQEIGEGGDQSMALAIKGELLLIAAHEPSLLSDAEERLGPFALDVAPSAGAREYLAALTTRIGLRTGTAADVLDLARRAREAGIVEELSSGVIGWGNVLYPLICAGGFALAETMVAEAFDELARTKSRIGTARAHSVRGFLHLQRGDVRGALADSRVAVDAGRAGGFQGWPVALGALVEALVEHGDPAAARAALEEAGLAGEVPDTFMAQWILRARGLLRLCEDRTGDAIGDLEELGRRAARRGHVNPVFPSYRPVLAVALLRKGDADPALRLTKEELTLAIRFGAPREIGIALRVRGLATGGEAGIDRLRESVDTLADSGARLEHARSLVELGAALRRARRRGEAREPLHAGMEIAHRCGAPPLVEQAREELLATGARPRRIMRTGVDALTPRELRVVRMAAEGMTNREIAQALFVTARTVEGHLTHAFQKLAIGSRDELSARLVADES